MRRLALPTLGILYIAATLLFAPWHTVSKEGNADVELAPLILPPSGTLSYPCVKVRLMVEVIAVEWAALGLAVWILGHRAQG